MNKLITVLFLLFTINSSAGELTNKQVIKNIGNIDSINFENSASVTVYLPDGYKGNNNKYPVMYVMDGERYFLNAIAYQKTLVWQEQSPDFIVVGINIEKKKRRELLGNKARDFINIFEHQIVSYVEKNYRTNDMNLYFGWELAGGFALDLFSMRPNLIDAYFLASSTRFTRERLDNVTQVLKSQNTVPEFLYYTLGEVESWAVRSHKMLAEILGDNTKENLKWKFNLSTDDNHYSSPLDTINKGLTQYFKGYSPIRFYSIKEFEDFGGLNALKTHYKNRGQHFNISTEIHDDTIHYLLNQSINDNEFEAFNMFVKEFDGFIAANNYSIGFIKKFGEFYVSNGEVQKAIDFYKSELPKNPGSEELQTAINRLTSKTKG